MRTWDFNANELLRVVKKAELPGFLQPPTPDDVGRVVFTQLQSHRRDNPYAITSIGTVVFCAPDKKRIKLVGKKKGKKVVEHEDGEYGELFVSMYFRQRVPKNDLTKLKS